MGGLGGVELQRPGDRLEHRIRRPHPPLLEADVVVDTDASHYGDLLAPQPWHPALAGENHRRPVGRDAVTAGPEESAELGQRLHSDPLWHGHDHRWP
jgi:hypothetical protein